MSKLEKLESLGVSPIDAELETREMMNSCIEPVEIGRLRYDAGDALEKLDPVAFREEVANFTDLQLEDGVWTEVEGELFLTEDVEELEEEEEDEEAS